MKTIADRIAHLRPCPEALTWLGKRTSIKRTRLRCQRADWMLWLAGRLGLHREAVFAACDIAEGALAAHWHRDDDRPALAISAARAWAADPTRARADDAAYAAYAAARAAAYTAHAAPMVEAALVAWEERT